MIFLLGWLILLLAISLHEFAHAWAADQLGDPTAKISGRLTLNPLAHLDPLGTVFLPLFLLFSGAPFFFGWAKPTPFDPFNLRHPKKDAAFISLAGPLSNLLCAFFLSLMWRFLPFFSFLPLSSLFYFAIKINVVLALFNLLPLHPLDGFKVVAGFLPERYFAQWMELEPYGPLFLFLLLFPFFGASALSEILSPLVNFFLSLLLPGKIGGII